MAGQDLVNLQLSAPIAMPSRPEAASGPITMHSRNESNGEVIYLCPFRLPDEGAASGRVLANAKAIRDAGFPVRLVGRIPDSAASDKLATFTHEDFEGCLIDHGASPKGRRTMIGRFLGDGVSAASWLEERFKKVPVQLVILVGCYGLFGARVIRACRRNRVPLICEVMEWQAPEFCPGGRFGRHRWEVELSLRSLMARAGNVIAISSFLEQHFLRRACQVIKVPPLVDVQEERWSDARARARRSEDGTVRLLFSGTWRRDRQDMVLRGMEILRARNRPVLLEYLGSSRKNLESYNGRAHSLLQVLGDSVKFHGFVPRDEVLQISASADFAILLRERSRWSEACFPSKTGELQALGIPMLCNLTSDLPDFLRDGENALVVPEPSVEAFVATVERALALSSAERERMRQHSLKCAKTRFDYRNYSDPLGEFIRKIS